MTVYVTLGAVALAVALLLWWLWRRWFWDNIFGVCMVSSISFSFAPLRITLGDLVHIEMQDAPHWIVTVTFAVLHFLTVNVRGAQIRWAAEIRAQRAERLRREEALHAKILEELLNEGHDIWGDDDGHPGAGASFRFPLVRLEPPMPILPLFAIGKVVLWR